jgi:hypothetical protein
MNMLLAVSSVTGIFLALMSFNSYSGTCTLTCSAYSCGLYSGAEMDACHERQRACLDNCMKSQYSQPAGSSSYSTGSMPSIPTYVPFLAPDPQTACALRYVNQANARGYFLSEQEMNDVLRACGGQ